MTCTNGHLDALEAGRSLGWICLASMTITTLLSGAFVGCDDDSSNEAATDLTSPELAGADSDGSALDVDTPETTLEPLPEACPQLALGAECFLPWPSDTFTVPTTTTTTGLSVDYGDVIDAEGFDIDYTKVHPADGFSPLSPIMAVVGEPYDSGALTTYANAYPASLASPTLLFNMTSGELVPHFAEPDPLQEADDPQVIFIRPLAPLEWATRYLVVVHGLTTVTGSPVAQTPGFAALVQDEPLADAGSRRRALESRYRDQIAPFMAAQSLESSIQVAWDFTTRSEVDATSDMIAVREQTVSALDAAPPAIRVIGVESDVSARIATKIEAVVTTPLFLESEMLEARLLRDESGAVMTTTTAEVPLTIWIPRSVTEANPGRLLQYGHGVVGSREEGDAEWLAEFIDDRGYVLFLSDWWGLSRADLAPIIAALLNQSANALVFVDRIPQGMANFATAARAMQTSAQGLPELQGPGGGLLFDPSEVVFWGISQGHILGGVYASWSPDIERYAMNVGGANWSLIMSRATAFEPFLRILDAHRMPRVFEHKFVAMGQTSFDRIDPALYAARVLQDTLQPSPVRQVLLQVGLGDSQVPRRAAHFHARSLEIGYLGDAPRGLMPPMMDVAQSGTSSALVEFDIGESEPLAGEAMGFAAETDVHDGIRRLSNAQDQVDSFFRTGVIERVCDGACDPD